MKKSGLRYARLSAAAGAVLFTALSAHAQSTTVTWDPSGVSPPVDGSGNWDTTSSQWYNGTTSSVGAWSNSAPDSALLGTGSNPNATGAAIDVFLNATNITTQDLIFGTAAGGGYYNLFDQGDGAETLTVNGNIIKSSAVGTSIIELANPMYLSAGNHVVAINDTPGAVPELAVDNPIDDPIGGGSASITVNNGFNSSGYTSYGTFVLNVANNYSGGTNIANGIVTDNATGALGTGTVTIGSIGCLAFGGNGTSQPTSMTVSNSVIIQRNTYTGTNFSDNPDAIISNNNGGGTVTFNGPFVVDTTNAQIDANTSTIVIGSNITTGPDVTNGVLTLTGDTAGYVTLTGNNSALTGGIAVAGNVELNVTSLANLGGATATLAMEGGDFHPVGGFITSFGALNVNYSTFSGGIDVDPNTTFSISQNLGTTGNTTGSVSERGAGTLNISGTDNLGGSTFWDGWSAGAQGGGVKGGVINVTGTVALGSLHLRSPSVNITGTLTLNDPGGGEYNSLGQDSTGTFGGPDEAVINISGNGVLDETTGDDFNVSDNPNTQGTINISGNGQLITGGITWLGKSAGGVGTINQNGGSLTINRNGNFGFVLGDGRNDNGGSPTGNYNLNTGTFTDENGEIYVGEGTNNGYPGIGNWTQTGGIGTFGNWFVVGREGAKGTVLISGGSLTKDTSNGGANVSIGEGGANVCTFTVDNTGVFNEEIGQCYVGNNSSVGILNVGSPTDPANASPSFTVNDWFAVGRNGTSVGTLNLYDGSVTQQTQNFFDIGGDGGSAQGTVNVYGGTLTALNTWIGENGSCVGILNMNGGSASLGGVELALGNTANGTINLNGGSLAGTSFTAQNNGGTGTPEILFNGGVLTTTSGNVNNNFVGAKIVSVVSTGGAIINANGGYINFNSALTHNGALSGADGGLTVQGTGTVQLGTPGSHSPLNTYTGPTSVKGGTLIISTTGALPTNTAVKITGGDLQLGASTGLATIASLAISGNGTFDVTNNHVIINYGSGTDPISSIAALVASGYNGGTWNGAGVISSVAAVTPGYGVGYADSADAGNPANLSSGTIELKYTLLGDANLDGIVNGVDFGILAANFNKGVTGWDKGDFNYDNVVSGIDFGDLAANFNKGASGTAIGEPAYDDPAIMQFAAANNLLADVPEPASIGLLALGGLTVMRRRRRSM